MQSCRLLNNCLGQMVALCVLLSLLAASRGDAQDTTLDSSVVRVTFSGLRLNRSTGTYDSVGTLTNVSSTPLSAPLVVAIRTTPTSVTLANADGTSASGLPTVTVPVPGGVLTPGASVSPIVLRFTNPFRIRFSFEYEVLGTSTIPTEGLVAYYPFSGNANDASGNGFDCVVLGPVLTTDRLGQPQSAFHFDGVDDFLECPNSPDLGVHQGVDMTLSIWVKPAPKLTGPFITQIIASKYRYYVPETSDFYVGLGLLADQTVESDTHATAQGFDGVFGPPPRFDKWSHIAVVYRGTVGDASLYLDGKRVGTASLTYNPVPSPENLLIGSSPLSSPGIDDPFFGGSIDDVRIYGRALTSQEIGALARE